MGDFDAGGEEKIETRTLTEQGSRVNEVHFKKGMSLTWKGQEDLTPASTKDNEMDIILSDTAFHFHDFSYKILAYVHKDAPLRMHTTALDNHG